MKQAQMQSNLFKRQFFWQLYNLTFLTLYNDVQDTEVSSKVLKLNFCCKMLQQASDF